MKADKNVRNTWETIKPGDLVIKRGTTYKAYLFLGFTYGAEKDGISAFDFIRKEYVTEKFDAKKYIDKYFEGDNSSIALYRLFEYNDMTNFTGNEVEKLKEIALDKLNTISMKHVLVFKEDFLNMALVVSGIGRYNKFKEFSKKLPNVLVTKEKLIEVMKAGYIDMLQEWTLKHNAVFLSHKSNSFQKYYLAYTVDKSTRELNVYLNVGKKNNADYFCLLGSIDARNMMTDVRLDSASSFLKDLFNDSSYITDFGYAKCYIETAYIKKTADMIPLDVMVSDLVASMKQIPELALKLKLYK